MDRIDIEAIKNKISIIFNGSEVSNVVVDEEFGNVTATVDGRTNTDCGFIEEFK
jgi:hypothetical protein